MCFGPGASAVVFLLGTMLVSLAVGKERDHLDKFRHDGAEGGANVWPTMYGLDPASKVSVPSMVQH